MYGWMECFCCCCSCLFVVSSLCMLKKLREKKTSCSTICISNKFMFKSHCRSFCGLSCPALAGPYSHYSCLLPFLRHFRLKPSTSDNPHWGTDGRIDLWSGCNFFFSDTEAWPTLLSVRYTAVLVYMPSVHDKSFTTFFFTYILTESVVRASQMTSQPVSSIFSVFHCHLGLGEL